MLRFVGRLCMAPHENESQKKSTVRLLRSLNLEDIESIMADDVSNLYLFLLYGFPRVALTYSNDERNLRGRIFVKNLCEMRLTRFDIFQEKQTVEILTKKAVCKSVFLTTWHCILSAELTKMHSWRFCPLGNTEYNSNITNVTKTKTIKDICFFALFFFYQEFNKDLLETCIDQAYFTEEVQMQNPRSGTNSVRMVNHLLYHLFYTSGLVSLS